MRILLLNGPNLNLLGSREPDIYGHVTLKDIETEFKAKAAELGSTVEAYQSNSEGQLVDFIQEKAPTADWLIINPAAYTHTSVAILDAIKATGIKTIEVHLSNTHSREEFRHHSFIAGIVKGRIMGFGAYGYTMALLAAHQQ